MYFSYCIHWENLLINGKTLIFIFGDHFVSHDLIDCMYKLPQCFKLLRVFVTQLSLKYAWLSPTLFLESKNKVLMLRSACPAQS